MLSKFPWLGEYLAMLGVGAMVSLSMLLLIRPRMLVYLGAKPYLSPNWLSIWRAPLVSLGLVLYLTAAGSYNQLWIGYLMVVVGLVMDRLDGKQAQSLMAKMRFLSTKERKAHGLLLDDQSQPETQRSYLVPGMGGHVWVWYETTQENEQGDKVKVKHPVYFDPWLDNLCQGLTKIPMFYIDRNTDLAPTMRLSGIGEWLDPMIDKLNFLPPFIYMGIVGLINPWVVALMVFSDFFSTIMRTPFDTLPVFKRLQDRFVREAKASPFGKSKVFWQFSTLLAVMPAAAGWLNQNELGYSYKITSGLLAIGVIAGVLSTLSRTTLMTYLLKRRELRKLNKDFGKVFEHEVAPED